MDPLTGRTNFTARCCCGAWAWLTERGGTVIFVFIWRVVPRRKKRAAAALLAVAAGSLFGHRCRCGQEILTCGVGATWGLGNSGTWRVDSASTLLLAGLLVSAGACGGPREAATVQHRVNSTFLWGRLLSDSGAQRLVEVRLVNDSGTHKLVEDLRPISLCLQNFSCNFLRICKLLVL